MSETVIYIDLIAAGIPKESQFVQDIKDTASGDLDFSVFLQKFGGLTSLFEAASAGAITWIESETNKHDLPVLFIEQGLGSDKNTAVLTLYPLRDVIDGNSQPEPFTGSDGKAYNQVAFVSLNTAIAGVSTYVCCMRVGIPADVSPSTYPSLDWSTLWATALSAVANAVDAAFGSAEDSMSASADEPSLGLAVPAPAPAAAAAVFDPVGVVGPIVGISTKVTKLIRKVKAIIEHATGLETLFFNLSSKPLDFSSSYYANRQTSEVVTSTGAQRANLAPCTLDAPVEVKLPGQKSLHLAQMITTGVLGNVSLHGTGLSFVAGSDGDTIGALINAPYSGANRIYAETGITVDAAAFWNSNNSKSDDLPVSKTLKSGQTLNLQLNAIHGTQPSGAGLEAYVYHAIVVVE